VAVSYEHGNESSGSQHVVGFSTSCRITSFSRMTVPQEGAVPNIYNNVILLFPLACHRPNGEHTLANIHGCQFLQYDVSDVVEIFNAYQILICSIFILHQ
jgi:hypothetical protein